MLTVELKGLDRVEKRLDAMRSKLRHLRAADIPHEMGDFETEDVHRHAPGVHRTRTGAKSKFRPHSRYEMMRHRRAVRRIFKERGIVRPASTRPILRQVMIDRLRERMKTMSQEKIKW